MIGFGYDSHRLATGESLIIGGVRIESEIGTIAHSDGDVLFHALCDALLGAAGLGDIGEYYPDSDPKYKNIDSSRFLADVLEILKKKKFEIVNIDATILLEKPKLTNYKVAIKNYIAEVCDINASRVNIKAKTDEKLGFVGRSEGIAAYCVCELKSAAE